MRFRVSMIGLMLFFVSLLLPISVHADDDSYYIFQVKENIENDYCDCSQVESVYEAAGIYRTNDYSIIQSLMKEGALVSCELDSPVSLFDMQEDITQLRTEDWSHAMLGVNYAEKNGLFGNGVKIGLIDSGIRADFAEITGAVVTQGVNYLVSEDSKERTDTDDYVGHGTFVASIIASDVVGIAPWAEIIPLKCFGTKRTSISYIVSAIYAAVDDYHCDIINMSLGTATDNPFLREAIDYAYDSGTILIAASGNLSNRAVSAGNDVLYYPAAYDKVIGVGAVDSEKQIASFSVQNKSVWVTAPGDGVTGLSRSGTGYKSGGGTSYAAPYVAAAAALALEADPELTPELFAELLKDTAEDLGSEGFDNTFGNGLINIGLLLAETRNDSNSLILSIYGGEVCISTYQPSLGRKLSVVLASYESDGRLEDTSVIFNGVEEYVLNNYALPDSLNSFAIFSMDEENFEPLTNMKKYNQ